MSKLNDFSLVLRNLKRARNRREQGTPGQFGSGGVEVNKTKNEENIPIQLITYQPYTVVIVTSSRHIYKCVGF